MFNSKTRLKANRQINTNSAKNGAHAIRSPVLPFSPEEKKQYQDALESHVRSFGEILKLNTDEKIPRMCQLDISLCTVDFGKVKSWWYFYCGIQLIIMYLNWATSLELQTILMENNWKAYGARFNIHYSWEIMKEH